MVLHAEVGEERGGSPPIIRMRVACPGPLLEIRLGVGTPCTTSIPAGQDSPCSSSITRFWREFSSFSMLCCCWLRSVLAAWRSFCRVRILERSCSSSCSILVWRASRASAGAVGTEPLVRAGSSCCTPRQPRQAGERKEKREISAQCHRKSLNKDTPSLHHRGECWDHNPASTAALLQEPPAKFAPPLSDPSFSLFL